MLTEKPGYKLMDIIFKKQEAFSVQEIVNDLKDIGINEETIIIKKALNVLRDKGILVQYGSRYVLEKGSVKFYCW